MTQFVCPVQSRARRMSLAQSQPPPAVLNAASGRFQLPDYYYFNKTPSVGAGGAVGGASVGGGGARRESAGKGNVYLLYCMLLSDTWPPLNQADS